MRAFYKQNFEYVSDTREFVIFVTEKIAIVGLNVNNIDDQAAQRSISMVAAIDNPVLDRFVFFN
ncbi:MAG: hypothetical protein ACREAU_00605 [Nitrosopumilaceae archaeon]